MRRLKKANDNRRQQWPQLLVAQQQMTLMPICRLGWKICDVNEM
jgi:hypothetical protein